MKLRSIFLFIFSAAIALAATGFSAKSTSDHMDLTVEILESQQFLKGQLKRKFVGLNPGVENNLIFYLHADLRITHLSEGAEVEELPTPLDRAKAYRLRLAPGTRRIHMEYMGTLKGTVEGQGSPEAITKDHVVLFAGTYWYPLFEDRLFSVKLEAVVESNHWTLLSQGRLTRTSVITGVGKRSIWEESNPQEWIYLVGGPFHKYTVEKNGLPVSVYLRSEDPSLAQTYLNQGHDYIELYSGLIAPYPYEKFAVIENFWETGYGMPSFTLLGPTVIRLPFIIHTSYPHEILHNWWGNGVYTSDQGGNWSEGLTSYMADHFMSQLRRKGDIHRRKALRRYKDFVKSHLDEFPLSEFKGRHDSSSQAIGYGKSMMFFHMLYTQLGQNTFWQGLSDFYRNNEFTRATYSDIREAMENASKRDLSVEFEQWIERVGAPTLEVSDATVEKTLDNDFLLRFSLLQTQEEAPYRLVVPIRVIGSDQRSTIYPHEHLDKDPHRSYLVNVTHRKELVELKFSERPTMLHVDPQFDVFRRLIQGEVPPTFSGIFGESQQVTFVEPTHSKVNYGPWIRTLKENSGAASYQVTSEDKMAVLPSIGSTWLLGNNPPVRTLLSKTLAKYKITLSAQYLILPGGRVVNLDDETIAIVFEHPNGEGFLGWFNASPDSSNLDRVAARLNHYGDYSVLRFKAEKVTHKEVWPSLDTPMRVPLK